jgi:hypothetical protein
MGVNNMLTQEHTGTAKNRYRRRTARTKTTLGADSMTTTNKPAGIDLDKLEALARKAYLANEVVAMIPPAKILDLIAQSRASQPEGATLASQEGITGTSQEETTGASESSQKLRGWLKGTVVTLPADFLHSVADELDDLRAQLAATTENLQTAVRQAWEANAELSKLRAAPGDSGFRKALEDILAMRGKGDCASDLIDIADSALAGLYAAPVAAVPPSDAKGKADAANAKDAERLACETAWAAQSATINEKYKLPLTAPIPKPYREWFGEGWRAAMAAVGEAGQEGGK